MRTHPSAFVRSCLLLDTVCPYPTGSNPTVRTVRLPPRYQTYIPPVVGGQRSFSEVGLAQRPQSSTGRYFQLEPTVQKYKKGTAPFRQQYPWKKNSFNISFNYRCSYWSWYATTEGHLRDGNPDAVTQFLKKQGLLSGSPFLLSNSSSQSFQFLSNTLCSPLVDCPRTKYTFEGFYSV